MHGLHSRRRRLSRRRRGLGRRLRGSRGIAKTEAENAVEEDDDLTSTSEPDEVIHNLAAVVRADPELEVAVVALIGDDLGRDGGDAIEASVAKTLRSGPSDSLSGLLEAASTVGDSAEIGA